MKLKKTVLLFLLVVIIIFACKKSYLDVPPIGNVDQSAVTNQKGVEGLLIGAYSMLDGFAIENYSSAISYYGAGSNWIYGSICGSEAYKGSFKDDQIQVITPIETFKATAINLALANKWAAEYAGVQRANEVLRVIGKATDIGSADRIRITAEARFLRGYYHFELIKVFGKVPYVDETVTYEAGNFYLPNDTMIWPAVERDFKFAMDNLPVIMTAAGRTNKYSSEAYLAKAFLFQHKYADAKPLLEDLINNGATAKGTHYALLDHYADNFNAETKNSKESVFAAQISVTDGSQGYNGNIGDILNYPNAVDAPGQCCGFFQPSQYLVNHFKTDPVTGLPDLINFNATDVKNDEGLKPDDPFTPDSVISLDPRIDWTVGRRGVPYLDWGINPGFIYDREPNFVFGPYSPVKNVYYKSQQANLTDAQFWTTGSNANNINLMRFADILLWAAEVEVEIGSPDKAEDYVNRVRSRMINPDSWVHKYIDNDDPSKGFTSTPAANYKISPYPAGYFAANGADYARKAIRYERMLELGMEGHRFFDLVRWGIADIEINNYLQHEKRAYFTGIHFDANNTLFPIPQTQIDLSAGPDGVVRLKQNPGY